MCKKMTIKTDNDVIKENDCRGARRQSLDKALYRAATRYEHRTFHYRLLGTGTNVTLTSKVSVLWLHEEHSGTTYQLWSLLYAF